MNEQSRYMPAWSVHAIGAAIIAVAGTCWYVAVVHPIVTASSKESILRSERDVIADEVAILTRQRDDSAARAREQEKLLESVVVRMRPASALNQVVADIARFANGRGIEIDQIQPGVAKDLPLAIQVPIRLSARGTSPDAVRFLSILHSTFPDIGVDGFEVARRDGKDSVLQVSLDITWYADRAGERPTTATVAP